MIENRGQHKGFRAFRFGLNPAARASGDHRQFRTCIRPGSITTVTPTSRSSCRSRARVRIVSGRVSRSATTGDGALSIRNFNQRLRTGARVRAPLQRRTAALRGCPRLQDRDRRRGSLGRSSRRRTCRGRLRPGCGARGCTGTPPIWSARTVIRVNVIAGFRLLALPMDRRLRRAQAPETGGMSRTVSRTRQN